jgi:polyhydroxyalkanoate synthase
MSEDTNSPANPVTLLRNGPRKMMRTITETLHRIWLTKERLDEVTSVNVGQTPSEVVYSEDMLELHHYEPQTDEQDDVPILVIAAIINKSYILDLQPDRSVIQHLLEDGHDVYLIKWNEPSRRDAGLTFGDYVNRYIDNCVEEVCKRSGQESINLLGYCTGGTMAAMYAALYSEKVTTLGLIASPLYLNDTGGLLELWSDETYYDPEHVTDLYGNMPSELFYVIFTLMDPVDNLIGNYIRLYENLEDEEFVKNFVRLDRWSSDGIDVAGETYIQLVEDIYQDDKLFTNDFYLNGEHVDITEIDMPVLQITGEDDHLIPSEASQPFSAVIGTNNVSAIEHSTGHIGLLFSNSSHEDVWPDVAEWFHTHSHPSQDEIVEEDSALTLCIENQPTEGDFSTRYE